MIYEPTVRIHPMYIPEKRTWRAVITIAEPIPAVAAEIIASSVFFLPLRKESR